MNIWLVVPYEPIPIIDNTGRDLRYLTLAKELARNIDFNITLWTSDFDHARKTNRFGKSTEYKVTNNFRIKFLYAGSYKKNISFARIKHNYLLSVEYEIESEKNKIKPDIIFCCIPTLELSKKVASYARINKIPLIVDIVDIWPDVYLTAFHSKIQSIVKYFLKNEYNKAKFILQNSSGITAVSESYLDWALKLLGRGRVITDRVFPLGYRSNLLDNKQVVDCQEMYINKFNIKRNTIVFTFIGQFEKSYDIGTIVEAAKQFDGNDNVLFILAGNGSKFLSVKEEIKALKNIFLTGWLNQVEMSALLRLSTIGLAAYSGSALQTLPYKPFEYMSAGLPILSSLTGELKYIIDNFGIGRTYKPSDSKSLCNQINWFVDNPNAIKEMADNSRKLFVSKYSNDVIYPKIVDYIMEIGKIYNSKKEE